MIDPERQNQEIAEHEFWLEQTLIHDERVPFEHLKQRVRVEIGEQWLARKLQEPLASSSTRNALRARIREAVTTTNLSDGIDQSAPRTWNMKPWLVGAGLGLAAMIALSVNLNRNSERVVVDAELPEVSAFEEAIAVEDFDSALTQLEEELDSFDAVLAAADDDEWMEDSTGL